VTVIVRTHTQTHFRLTAVPGPLNGYSICRIRFGIHIESGFRFADTVNYLLISDSEFATNPNAHSANRITDDPKR